MGLTRSHVGNVAGTFPALTDLCYSRVTQCGRRIGLTREVWAPRHRYTGPCPLAARLFGPSIADRPQSYGNRRTCGWHGRGSPAAPVSQPSEVGDSLQFLSALLAPANFSARLCQASARTNPRIVGRPKNDAAEPYQKWSFTINRAPVKVSPWKSKVSEFSQAGDLPADTTFFS